VHDAKGKVPLRVSFVLKFPESLVKIPIPVCGHPGSAATAAEKQGQEDSRQRQKGNTSPPFPRKKAFRIGLADMDQGRLRPAWNFIAILYHLLTEGFFKVG
jgi:hypothetical protein